jgi:tetratricopeptide (TPR) repeat protein
MAEEDARQDGAAGNLANAAILFAASREKADSFVDKQNELADLQIEDLKRENRVRHWSLRVRHISDVLNLGFELAVAFIVVAIAVGLGVVIWQAAHADGLVIESFDVPQGMAQKGLTGQVIAGKLLDHLTVMQNQTDSSRGASSFANDWTNDIKVEIPDTGVSLGQIVRFLDGWLGHQMHLSGELYETPSGVALTVRMENEPGQTFEGNAADLNGVVTNAAEAVYARAQPYRYSAFLLRHGRFAESVTVARRLAAAGPREETAWANVGLAIMTSQRGDMGRARAYIADGLKANPDLPNLSNMLSEIAFLEGHEEEALLAQLRSRDAMRGKGAREWSQDAIPSALEGDESAIALLKGDYLQASAKNVMVAGGTGGEYVVSTGAFLDVSMHDGAAARKAFAALDDMHADDAAFDADSVRAYALMDQKGWLGTIALLEASMVVLRREETRAKGWFDATSTLRIQVLPQLAYAYVMLGEFDKADAIFNTLPQGCDVCMRCRGQAEAGRHNWSAAAHRFALVSARSPDIPVADTDWGAMLLRKGDLDDAIAKFESAHRKGPHFADPLEMWGEALTYLNRKDEAAKQFALARSLDG